MWWLRIQDLLPFSFLNMCAARYSETSKFSPDYTGSHAIECNTSSNHTKAFVQCCHGKHAVASSRTLLSDHVCIVTDVRTSYLETIERSNCGGWLNTPMFNDTRAELNVTNLNKLVGQLLQNSCDMQHALGTVQLRHQKRNKNSMEESMGNTKTRDGYFFANKTSLMPFFTYLLYPSQLYMFRMLGPSILRSTVMYRREGTVYVRMQCVVRGRA